MSVRPNGSTRAGLMKTPFKRKKGHHKRRRQQQESYSIIGFSCEVPLFWLLNDKYLELQIVCDAWDKLLGRTSHTGLSALGHS